MTKFFYTCAVLLGLVGLSSHSNAQQQVASLAPAGVWVGQFDGRQHGCVNCQGAVRLKIEKDGDRIVSVHLWSKEGADLYKRAADPALPLNDKGPATLEDPAKNVQVDGDTISVTYQGDLKLIFSFVGGRIIGTMNPTLHPEHKRWYVVNYTLDRAQ